MMAKRTFEIIRNLIPFIHIPTNLAGPGLFLVSRGFIRHETSLTSIGLGAQKAALAILDKEGDPDMKKRIRLVPLVTFGPFAFIPLVLVGFALDYFVFNGTSGTFCFGWLCA